MRLYWRTGASTSRHELEDYVRSVRVDVRCWDEAVEREHLVARLGVDQVLWGDAASDGESLAAVCDADSQGLHDVHAILNDGGDEVRDDLGVELPFDSLVFVHAAVFHPGVRPSRVAVLDAVFNLFGPSSLAVMWREVGHTPEREQVELGLARVAGSNLVFRHNALITPYSEQHPRGMDVDHVGTPDAGRWVRRRWRRRFGP